MNPAALYLGVKGVAYVLWSYFGLRFLTPSASLRIPRALALGFLRLLMGVGFGLVIWQVSTLVYQQLGSVPARDALTYLLVYVPIRWVEWSILHCIFDGANRSVAGFFLGRSNAARLWRIGGIAISCLADIPIIASAGGLPIGRFFC